ncbi:MAG TPA: hypothetical protein ENG51_23385 [Deltaproteobacteria bacterium]|nr:MAG: hypothetical protein DRG83_21485 [Deltaproteobacteria bacterium]HDM79379.1 hypothetical protein [Deltaproteobacteria bacterium]
MVCEELYSGKVYTLYVIVKGKKCPIQEFINSLDEKRKGQALAQLQFLADHGPLYNPEKFRWIKDKIFELKTRSGVRILGFFAGQRKIVLTHGFLKGKVKAFQREVKKAQRLRKRLMQDCEIT